MLLAKRLAAGAALLVLAFAFGLAGAWYAGQLGGTAREGSHGLAGGLERPPGGGFVLSDHTGKLVDSSAMGERHLLLYFGYTQCNEACPIALWAMSEAVSRLSPEEAERVAPLFITIDPLLDNGPALAAYLEGFHPALRGLTGEADAIASAAAAYRVAYDETAQIDEEGFRVIEHGTALYLMAPDGDFLRQFDYRVTPERLAEVLKVYLGSDAAS
ncbi:MAG: SCO family protein [Pseudomonadota bacterium]